MARGRMLNKSISVSKKFHLLPDDTCRLMATWLIAHLDKNGVFYADPVIVKSLIFPRRGDISVEQVELYIASMQKVGLVILFTTQDQLWQYWPGFTDNQTNLRPDRESTDFPAPVTGKSDKVTPNDDLELPQNDDGESPEGCRDNTGNNPASSPPKLIEVKLIEEKTTEQKTLAGSRQFTDDDLQEVSTAYEANIGFISPLASDELKDLLSFYGKGWILDAFKVAVKANKRRLDYVSGILRKWETEGRTDGRPNGNGPPGQDEPKQKFKITDKRTGEAIT